MTVQLFCAGARIKANPIEDACSASQGFPGDFVYLGVSPGQNVCRNESYPTRTFPAFAFQRRGHECRSHPVGDSILDEIFRSTLPPLGESRYRRSQGIYSGSQQGLDSRLGLLISRAPLACYKGPSPVPRLTHIRRSLHLGVRPFRYKWALRSALGGFAPRYADSSENHPRSRLHKYLRLEMGQVEAEGGRIAPIVHLPRFRQGFSYPRGCMAAQAVEPPQDRVTVKILSRQCQ